MKKRITAALLATGLATGLAAGITTASTANWTGTAAISSGMPYHWTQPAGFPHHT